MHKMKKVIQTNNAPAAIGPYSQAIAANGMLYISGQIAIDPASGELVLTDIKRETRQVLNNLSAVLEAAGSDLNKVVKCSIFLNDMAHYADVNNVYSEYFNDAPPAREAMAVRTLPKEVNVEISAIALCTSN